jgi:hypothetical protein
MIGLQRLAILRFPSFWNTTRIDGASPVVADPDAQGEKIDPPNFISSQGSFLEMKEEILRRIREKRNQYRDRRNG